MTVTMRHQGRSPGDCSCGEGRLSFPSASKIRAIIFDLDGTLYVSDEFATAIQLGAASYLSRALGMNADEARSQMAETRKRLKEEQGGAATLSRVCISLGGSVREMHAFFCETLEPESYLAKDNRVVDLLERLGRRFKLYLYTNNNRLLSERITHILGVDGCFTGMYAIDDDWKAKPDEEKLGRILKETGVSPCEALFVGDRYDVDLRLPEEKGCPVYLSQNVEQLLMLEQLLRYGG